MIRLAQFVGGALGIIGLTAVTNSLLFPRLRWTDKRAGPAPLVSILIPARNEAAVIGATVRRLLAQDYPHFELLLLDDESTDGTAELARAAAGGDPRLRLLAGRPLPPGWLGKNWACQQLAEAAAGDILLFTDADVQWGPGALAAVVTLSQAEGAGLLTIWPTQQTESWGERLVVPLIALAILGYLPLPPVHHLSWPIFAAANGQCLAFRREAYRAAGGHAAVRDQIVEDVQLARRVKASGGRLRMADGAGLVSCRMYRSWPEVRDGFAKNILAGHGGSPLFLLLSTLFHWLLFVWPWLWLLFGRRRRWAAGLALGGVAVRGVTAVATGQRLRDAPLMPLSVILMTRIAGRALRWHRQGGPHWKGRQLSPAAGAARAVRR